MVYDLNGLSERDIDGVFQQIVESGKTMPRSGEGALDRSLLLRNGYFTK